MTATERATSALNDGNLVWSGANVDNQLAVLTSGKTTGGHVRLYAPATWDDGSSVSHWDTTTAPNLLMEPYASGSTKGYTDLTTCVLYDIGWTGSHCPDVAGANAVPVASGQSVSTTAGSAVSITLSATDADSTSLTYSIVTGPANGVLGGSGGARTYTPNSGFTGTDSFTFQASDGFASSNIATVTISVSAVASGGNAGNTEQRWWRRRCVGALVAARPRRVRARQRAGAVARAQATRRNGASAALAPAAPRRSLHCHSSSSPLRDSTSAVQLSTQSPSLQ